MGGMAGLPSFPPDLPSFSDGRFVLVSRIGQGAIGAVYRGFDRKQRGWRAFKLLLPDALADPRARERFASAGEALAGQAHPNVVRVYEVGAATGVPYVVMELVTGGTLAAWVERHGPMPAGLACGSGIELARGLAAVHASGTVHGRVSANNGLVTTSGVRKLGDAGLAVPGGDPREDVVALGQLVADLAGGRAALPDALRGIVDGAGTALEAADDLADALERVLANLPPEPPSTPDLVIDLSDREVALPGPLFPELAALANHNRTPRPAPVHLGPFAGPQVQEELPDYLDPPPDRWVPTRSDLDSPEDPPPRASHPSSGASPPAAASPPSSASPAPFAAAAPFTPLASLAPPPIGFAGPHPPPPQPASPPRPASPPAPAHPSPPGADPALAFTPPTFAPYPPEAGGPPAPHAPAHHAPAHHGPEHHAPEHHGPGPVDDEPTDDPPERLYDEETVRAPTPPKANRADPRTPPGAIARGHGFDRRITPPPMTAPPPAAPAAPPAGIPHATPPPGRARAPRPPDVPVTVPRPSPSEDGATEPAGGFGCLRWLLLPVAGGLALGMVAFAGIAVLLGTAAIDANQHAKDLATLEQQLYRTLDADRSAIDRLAEVGDRARIEQAYARYVDHRVDAQRLPAALDLALVLTSEAESIPAADHGSVGEVELVHKMRQLRAARQRYIEELADWREASTSTRSRLAQALHIAPSPPSDGPEPAG